MATTTVFTVTSTTDISAAAAGEIAKDLRKSINRKFPHTNGGRALVTAGGAPASDVTTIAIS